MSTERLFTYGTLMRMFDSSIARYLRENSIFRGEASLRGRLFDLGQYPGLLLEEDAPGRVYGQVFELVSPEQVLGVLDQYEMVDPRRPGAGEYKREQVWVDCEGTRLLCWAYLLNRTESGMREIASGDYRTYVIQNVDHQKFIDST